MSYNNLFLTREINLNSEKFGKLSLINEAFQYCYLNRPEASSAFINEFGSLLNYFLTSYKLLFISIFIYTLLLIILRKKQI